MSNKLIKITAKLGTEKTEKLLDRLLKVDEEKLNMKKDRQLIEIIGDKVANFFELEKTALKVSSTSSVISDAKIVAYALCKKHLKKGDMSVIDITKWFGAKDKASYYHAVNTFADYQEAYSRNKKIRSIIINAYEQINAEIDLELITA